MSAEIPRGQMGFIEKLEQDIESKEKRRSEAEAKEISYHEERKAQTLAAYRESGVGILVRKLTEVLKKSSRLIPDFGFACLDLEVANMDIDSIVDRLEFDSSHERNITDPIERVIRGVYPFTVTSFERRRTINNVYRHKVILVETRPDGNIVFHGAKPTTISKMQWQENQEALEVAFEAAFNNPRIIEQRDSRLEI